MTPSARHIGGWHDRLNRYVLCFHDEILECLAERVMTTRHLGTPRAVLSDLVGRMLG